MSLKDELAKEPNDADQKQIRALKDKLATEKAKREAAEKKNDALQKILDHQSEVLETRARQLFRSPKAHQNAKGGHFHRVLIPDTHGAHIDKHAAATFLADLEYLQPREVVWLGDHLDCGGFLSQHHTIGFVAEMAYSYADDIAAGNDFVDEVQKRTPSATHHWLTGNHEHRVQRWCVQQATGSQKDAAMHLKNYSVDSVLYLEKRGINYYPRDYKSRTNHVQGSIRLGSCNFVHDVSTSKTPARDALNKWAANVQFGDTHRIDVAYGFKGGRWVGAATNGHLSSNRRYWQETNLADWIHGYGVQIVGRDFLHIVVPFVDGRSLLGPLLGRVK
jgi:hypothetical protein